MKLKYILPIAGVLIVAIIYASSIDSQYSQSESNPSPPATAPGLTDNSQETLSSKEQTSQGLPSNTSTQQPPTPAVSEEFWFDAQILKKNHSDEDSSAYTVEVKRNRQGSNTWGVITIDLPVKVSDRQLEPGKRYSFKGIYSDGAYRVNSLGMIFCPDCEQ